MNGKKTNVLTNILFVIYLIALFWIILFKLNLDFSHLGTKREINLIPFHGPLILNGNVVYGEIVMNILIFVPLGIYSGIIFKDWKIWKKIILFFLISLSCEVFQFVFGAGVSDVTDLINNTTGGLIGLITYFGIEKAINNSRKTQIFINVVAAACTVLMVLFLVLLKVNRLWLFRM